MTFEAQRTQYIGVGVSWNRRSVFDYGWVSLDLPFVCLVLEWSPDNDAFYAKYGVPGLTDAEKEGHK